MVEQRSPKPRAEGSSPSAPAKKKKSRFTALFSFSFVQTVLKTRHAERVEGCGSPVETSKHRRCLEAPTEPAGEKKSFCPCQKKHRFFGAFFLYLRCFTAFLLAFLIYIKLRRTVFSVRRFFIVAPFFVHFVPHSPPNPFGTSSKKHQS